MSALAYGTEKNNKTKTTLFCRFTVTFKNSQEYNTSLLGNVMSISRHYLEHLTMLHDSLVEV